MTCGLLGLGIGHLMKKETILHRHYFRSLYVWLGFSVTPRIVAMLLRSMSPSTMYLDPYKALTVAMFIQYVLEFGPLPGWCMRAVGVPALTRRSIRLQWYFFNLKAAVANILSFVILMRGGFDFSQGMIKGSTMVPFYFASTFSTLYMVFSGTTATNLKDRACFSSLLFIYMPIAVAAVVFFTCAPSSLAAPLVMIAFCFVALWSCYWWMDIFSRAPRWSRLCPSNKPFPRLAACAGSASSCPFLQEAGHLGGTTKKNDMSGTSTSCTRLGMTTGHEKPNISNDRQFRDDPSTKTSAVRIDMDHVHLSFFDFISAVTLIAPSSTILLIKGFGFMYIRRLFHKWGLLKASSQTESGTKQIVFRLVTESPSLPPYLSSIKSDDKTGDEIATFIMDAVPLIRNNGDIYIANLRVCVSLKRQEMVEAHLDGRGLDASEAYIILSHFVINVSHPKIHGLANWSIGLGNSTTREDIWNSKCTMIYNYMGYRVSSRIIMILWWVGLLTPKVKEFQRAFDIALHHGVPNHDHVTKLAKHSRVVSFLLRLRVCFKSAFKKYKHDFPEVKNAESLFLRTVVHSMDHNMIADHVQLDYLWGAESHPEFGGMAEMVQLSRSSFVEDLPFLPFNPKLGAQRHPFYRAVYANAVKIDRELADGLDACIIK